MGKSCFDLDRNQARSALDNLVEQLAGLVYVDASAREKAMVDVAILWELLIVRDGIVEYSC